MRQYNALSGTIYSEENAKKLEATGHKDPRWLTLNQADKQGLRVDKGTKGVTLEASPRSISEEGADRQFVVYNVTQLERQRKVMRPPQDTSMPHNPISGTIYGAENSERLMQAGEENGNHGWITPQQAKDRGLMVKKDAPLVEIEAIDKKSGEIITFGVVNVVHVAGLAATRSLQEVGARKYLHVPRAQKEEAKEVGIRFDGKAQAWYAPGNVAEKEYARWKSPQVQEAPEVGFSRELRSIGLDVEHPKMDGKFHRVAVEGDKPNEQSGSYRGYIDGRPNGIGTNFRTAEEMRWVSDAPEKNLQQARSEQEQSPKEQSPQEQQVASPKEQASQRDHDSVLEPLATTREADIEAAGKKAYGVFKNAKPAVNEHPYLEEKGVKAHGLKVDSEGVLLMPVHNSDDQLTTLQRINPDGRKTFLKDGEKSGGMHVVGAQSVASLGKEPIIIAEGYATAASIHESTKRPVVAAFDSGNLKPVAEALRARYPEAKILIATDNDHALRTKEGEKNNVGVNKAKEAAQAVGGSTVTPLFNDDQKKQGMTDFNDLARAAGGEKVSELVNGAIKKMEKGQEKGKETAREKEMALTA